MKINIFFILYPIFLFSQIGKVTVKYKVIITNDDKLATNDLLKEYYKSAMENAKYLEFNLSITNKESYFYDTEILDNSDFSGAAFSKAFCGYTSTTYSEKDSNVYYQSFDDKILGKYVLKKEKKVDWELTNEEKTIEGFLCYKAIMRDIVINPISLKSSTYIVTAWYAPTLPFSVGPLDYFGLPGLILQVERRGVVFGASLIKLNPENEPLIIKPSFDKIRDSKEIENFKINYFKRE
jgi:GLPGLI family protein